MMYAISLHQPWASFIAKGIKPFETRGWAPPRWLIGKRIAIHAGSKVRTVMDRQWAVRRGVPGLPLGAIVCTAVLAGAYRMGVAERVPGSAPLGNAFRIDEYGDYSPGRWAWWLTEVDQLEPPIATRGAQGFWKLPGIIDLVAT
jgi:hypothetical protein